MSLDDLWHRFDTTYGWMFAFMCVVGLKVLFMSHVSRREVREAVKEGVKQALWDRDQGKGEPRKEVED